MLDSKTYKLCKQNSNIRNLKIKSLEFAVSEALKIIKEAKINKEDLTFLQNKIKESKKVLNILYLMN